LTWFIQNIGNLTNGPLAVWSGGLSIFGAVLGGLLGAWLYCSKYHNSIAKFFFYIVSPILLIVGLVLAVYGLTTAASIPLVIGLVITVIFVGVTDEWLKYSWLLRAIWQRVRGNPVTPYQRGSFKTDFPDAGMPIAPWLDIAGVAMPLAQAIGRWANYVNQELYGPPTTLPWGIPIDSTHRIGEYASMIEYNVDRRFHPLFLYESLLNIILFFVLLNIFNRRRAQWRLRDGDIFLLYLMGYSLIRFLLEFIRVEIATIPGTSINSSQAFTLVVFLLAGAVFAYRRSTAPKAPTEPVTPAPQAE
jgi:prolipoprotein diacylglyceryltransferase